ncbi:peroxisomal sarcosine oxidase [Echeneis naucrates]|uniref:Peroxisomal sarcosine oxidase n=1 Tax=Echeneis naucrates TaxID=173247 RepID=A0A665WQC1_ECHNA|nr:peroxisomal sarcosine oxidase [Echeneis naucrates]XP_029373812.1 peroxisomal sarcosine oxidase [Echeneis naucrates]
MSAAEDFDCVVVGAGVQGSFTAHQLAQKNQRTLLLDQFVLPHTRGSSHGQTRIIRKAYEQDFYTHMMEECYALWAQLERETGVKLYRQTGLLVMGPEKSQNYQLLKTTLERNKVPLVLLTRDNFSQHIPNFTLAEGDGALVDITAGILYADRTLRTVQAQFQKLGGIIRDKEKVMDIKPGPVVTVSTSAGVYRAKRLVITAGPWTNRLLSHTDLQLPLEVVKINVCYWKEKVPGTYSVKRRFPCFVLTEGEETNEHIYGLPSDEYPGLVKICYHNGVKTDPDQRDKQTDRSDINLLQKYVARCVPGLIPEPAVVESCMYTMTPDRHFVLDCHPKYSNIVIGAGFSGHGFKFGPIVGKLLCELSLGEVPSYDLSPFRIRRFQTKTKSAL